MFMHQIFLACFCLHPQSVSIQSHHSAPCEVRLQFQTWRPQRSQHVQRFEDEFHLQTTTAQPPYGSEGGGIEELNSLLKGSSTGTCGAWQQSVDNVIFSHRSPHGRELWRRKGWCVEIKKLGQSLQDAWKLCIRCRRAFTTSAKHVNNAMGHLTPFPPDALVYIGATLSWRLHKNAKTKRNVCHLFPSFPPHFSLSSNASETCVCSSSSGNIKMQCVH